ncbi:MAG: GNAT family N-acetyltransferase [Candidatus Sumerlaeia bacterium]
MPDLEIPDDFHLCHYEEDKGYEDAWKHIIAESFQEPHEKYDFKKIMKGDKSYRPDRVWFIVKDDEPVATASAFCWPRVMEDAGMVHYVGVLPTIQGKRLGYWISLAAMYQMTRDGFERAWLSTDDFRLPAIKTYLNLGFEPLLVHENQVQRWKNVFNAMGRPDFTEKFKPIFEKGVKLRVE